MTPRANASIPSIATIAANYGWGSGSLNQKILEAADGAAPGFAKDGAVSLEELKAALAAPATQSLISTDALARMQALIGTSPGQAISTLQAWCKTIATTIDTTSGVGNKDGKLSAAEVSAYIDATNQTAGTANGPLTAQRVAMLQSVLNDAAGRPDLLSAVPQAPGPSNPRLRPLYRDYYRAMYDDQKKIPLWVSYELSANDDHQRQDTTRKNTFRADTDLPAAVRALPAWYDHSGYDQGHQMPYEDYADPVAANDTFLLSNMVPQTPQLNEQSWKTLEAGIRQLVDASGGTAQVFTGSLFLDDKGQPLPNDKIQYIGPDANNPAGTRRVAVPTHCYKAVLLTLPNGTQKAFAYVVPNRSDLPTKKDGIATLLQNSLVSIDALQKKSGMSYFQGLSPAAATSLKASKTGLADLLSQIVNRQPPAGSVAAAVLARSGASRKPAIDAASLGTGGALEALGLMWPKTLRMPAATTTRATR